jgi:hypothetical protein
MVAAGRALLEPSFELPIHEVDGVPRGSCRASRREDQEVCACSLCDCGSPWASKSSPTRLPPSRAVRCQRSRRSQASHHTDPRRAHRRWRTYGAHLAQLDVRRETREAHRVKTAGEAPFKAPSSSSGSPRLPSGEPCRWDRARATGRGSLCGPCRGCGYVFGSTDMSAVHSSYLAKYVVALFCPFFVTFFAASAWLRGPTISFFDSFSAF